MRIAIVQEIIPPYRIAFFEQLNEALGGELVLYSTEPLAHLSVSQVKIEAKKIGKVVLPLQWNSAEILSFDLIVMMFDLRWLELYKLLALYPHKTILWGHGMGSKPFLARLKTWCIQRSQGFIAYEEDSVEFFKKRGLRKSRLRFAGNTIYLRHFELSPFPREYFLFLGRLQERKQIQQVIEAIARLPEALKYRCRLLIMGDGDMRGSLEQCVASHHLQQQCQFVNGSYQEEDIAKVLSKAIAYVSPGHVGLGVLHAFAFGVPVITKRQAAHAPEIINVVNAVNGLLIDDSIASLSSALAYYLQNPEVHQKHCIAAHQRYQQHRQMWQMVERFHDALLQFNHQKVAIA